MTSRSGKVSRRYFRVLLQTAIGTVLQRSGRPFFINIGANDGQRFDWLHGATDLDRWDGIMVEPDPAYFAELTSNFADHPGIMLENVAISDRSGHARFYAPRPTSDMPEWAKGIGSLQAGHAARLGVDGSERAGSIEEIDVRCETLTTLMERLGVQRIDVMSIDTEGHDWVCLQQLASVRVRPSLVVWETDNLSAELQVAAEAFMAKRGYRVTRGGSDNLAIDLQCRDLARLRWLVPLRYALGAGR